MKQKTGMTRTLSTIAIGLFGTAVLVLERRALLERDQHGNRPGGHAHRRRKLG
jgi:hypothetical protein